MNVEAVRPLSDSETREDYHYGFNNSKSGFFNDFVKSTDVCPYVKVKYPEKHSHKERWKLKEQSEDEDFNEDHYLANLFEVDPLTPVLNYKPDYLLGSEDSKSQKVKELLDRVGQLPTPCDIQEDLVLRSLADILLAYAYDRRVSLGLDNVESGWNIIRLTGTLCYFVTYPDCRTLLFSMYRRLLVYPLYRNWALCEKVKRDAVHILLSGRDAVLHCLLEVADLLMGYGCDALVDLYLEDTCRWLASITDADAILKRFAKELRETKITKCDVNLGLVELEEDAKRIIEAAVAEQLENAHL